MSPDELKRKFPNASRSFIQINAPRLCAADAKSTEGGALVGISEGDAPRRLCPAGRAICRITVYACRPADADGYHVKELIDLLVSASVLDGDSWDKLAITITSEKVHKAKEERTEIVIEWPCNLKSGNATSCE